MRFSCRYPVILICAAVCCGNTWGQGDYTRELYGNGVHAFNAGRLSQASQHLEAAIAQGSQDPRVYYFLGLTKLKSGDALGAESDFNKAATFEFQGRGTYDVGMALSRVQGQSRMRLENVHRFVVAIVPAFAEMRRVVGEEEEERPRGVATAEVTHGLIRDGIRGIARLVEKFAIAVPIGRVAVAHGKEIHTSTRVPVGVVKAMSTGVKLGLSVPEMPFAYQRRVVAACAKDGRNSGLILAKTASLVLVAQKHQCREQPIT